MSPDAPLLLETAARLAFPDGAISALTLRRAASRGELSVAKIGGRVFTTLADIDAMVQQCRQKAKALASGGGGGDAAPMASASSATGSSKMMAESELALASAQAVADELRRKPSKPLPVSSWRDIKFRESEGVLRWPSKSRT